VTGDRVICVVCGWTGLRERCAHEDRDGAISVHHGQHCGVLVQAIPKKAADAAKEQG